MENTLFAYIVLILLVSGGGVMGPSQHNSNVNSDSLYIQKEIETTETFESIKDSIIKCMSEIEESRDNISKNKPYLKKLEDKIQKKNEK